MQLGSKEQETLRQYLLGRLPSDEFAPLEERLMTDSGFYEELLIVEDELIDQYLRGQQTEEERASFETHFLLTPERQQKTRFARSLRKYLDGLEGAPSEGTVFEDELDEAPTRAPASDSSKRRFLFLSTGNPVLAYSMAAALVLVVGGVSWLALKNLRRPVVPDQVLTVVLTPGLTRSEGDQSPRVQIPSAVNILQLQLTLPATEYSSYRAELLTSDRAMLWSGDGLQPDSASGSRSIRLKVPARLFRRDDYLVKLTARRADGAYENVATYVFRVVN